MSRARSTAGSPASSLKQIAQATKSIAHPARIRILAMLQERTLCVCQMTAVLGLAYPTVSGHLNELRRSGLVTEEKQGKLVFYRLEPASPFAGVVFDALELAAADETVMQDRAIIDRVRAMPVQTVTGARCNLRLLGITRSSSVGGRGR